MLNLKPADDRSTYVQNVVQWFTSDHLPEGRPRAVSKAVENLVDELLTLLPDSADLTVGLRELLATKDTLVRAALLADHAERLAAG